ncbi:hypothetical protein LCGC14_2933130, partial [marine sediment metagenome]
RVLYSGATTMRKIDERGPKSFVTIRPHMTAITKKAAKKKAKQGAKKGAKKIVHIDFWPCEIDEDYQVEVDISADIAAALWQINEEINDRMEGKSALWNIKDRALLRQTILDDFALEKDDVSFPMKPQKVVWDVREFMDPKDILLSDVGAHKMWISRYYQCDEPNTCLISNGFCSMGFAFPGSIGAKTAKTLEQSVGIIDAITDAAKTVRDDVIVLCHGGPIAEPDDAQYILGHCKAVDGFYGASSMERLPTERAIREQTAAFTEIRKG